MTPKEKAQQLFDKYFQIFDNIDYHGLCGNMEVEIKNYSKQSALIAVDEILNEFPQGYKGNFEEKRMLYWQQVKQEIVKL